MPHTVQVYESFSEFRDSARRLVDARPIVSVGSFDGVHLGHQYMLAELVEWARREQAPAVVVTFRRHPREYMLNIEIPSLNTAEHKVNLLKESGIDAIVLLDFNETLRQLTAEQFMRQCIHGSMGTRAMLVGFNNRFGKDGEGTFEVVREIGKRIGIEVREGERIEVSGQAMSSSAIRKHIANGDFLWARKMLGRPYSIAGVVQKGDQRGRSIGFPTANIGLKGLAYPPLGVYGVQVWVGDDRYVGACNIGTRPTVDPSRREPLLEVHLLDFSGELYGQEIDVEFMFHVRPEQKFASLDALRAQLARDVAEIRGRVTEAGA